MSRDWDDEDQPRRRRQRDDDYGDVRTPGPSSGGVTGVGVISIIIGSLTLLCGLCLVIGSVGFAGGAGGGPGPFGGQNFFPFQMAAGILIVFALVILVFGVLYLVGGIGVLQRRNWGRIMTLVMGGFSILFGILQLIGAVTALAAAGPAESKVIALLINLLAAAVFFTHGIMAFVVLLSAQNAREFE